MGYSALVKWTNRPPPEAKLESKPEAASAPAFGIDLKRLPARFTKPIRKAARIRLTTETRRHGEELVTRKLKTPTRRGTEAQRKEELTTKGAKRR